MPRILIALVLVSLVWHDAAAGQRCIKRPEVVMWTADADVHEDGRWHRTIKGVEKTGRLSRDAYGRWHALYRRDGRSKASDARLIACLDALIAGETSKAATKACAVKRAKAQR